MENGFYYSSIRAVSLAIANAFTGIKIAKTDGNGRVTEMVDVPLKYGLKAKDFYFRTDNKFNPQLPIMAMHSTQLAYSTDRATQKMMRVYLDKNRELDQNKIVEMMNPVPGDISYTLEIATKFVLEAEQILEQILPFFNPFLMISVPIPEIGFSYDAKVTLGGVSENQQADLNIDEMRNILGTIDMTCAGYLFRPVTESSIITKIVLNYYNGYSKEQQMLLQQIIDGTVDPIKVYALDHNFEEDLGLTK